MKTPYFILASAIILIALSAVPVFAPGYAPNPIVSSEGAPALSGNQMSGVLVLKYYSLQNQVPLVLQNDKVTLRLCGTGGCVNVVADLSQTGPGTYAYTFTPQSPPTGAVTITLPAGGLIDDYGRPFPSVDTQVGAYSLPSPSSPSVSTPPPSVPTQPASSPETTPHIYREAVPLATHNAESESHTTQTIVGSIITILAAFGLLLLPRRQ